MSGDFTVYQATNPATAPETLARMATERPDLRQFVAANPATPAPVVEWLGTLGDLAVDAALARRRPAVGHRPADYPPPSGQPSTAAAPAPPAGTPSSGGPHRVDPPAPGPAAPVGQPWVPTSAAAGHATVPSSHVYPAAANPYAAPSPAGPSGPDPYAAPGGPVGEPGGYTSVGGPVSGTPQDAYGYRLPEPGGRRTGLVVAVVAGALLLVGALVFAGTTIFGVLADDSTYGEDPDLDRLWDGCAAGDGQACDDLYLESPLDSGYEEFGDTCGDRFPPQQVWCVDVM